MRAFSDLKRSVSGGSSTVLRERERVRRSGHSLSGRTVVLDPGHGGSDAGATRNGLREADVVLDLARRIEGRLTAIGVDVVFTRTETTCPTDEERAAIANRSGADVVLSLHCDSHDHVDASGVATFFFGRDRRNAWSAIGEHLADLVLREVVARTPLANCRSHGRSWTLLQQTTMPTVRVEAGYLSHPEDAALLADRVSATPWPRPCSSACSVSTSATTTPTPPACCAWAICGPTSPPAADRPHTNEAPCYLRDEIARRSCIGLAGKMARAMAPSMLPAICRSLASGADAQQVDDAVEVLDRGELHREPPLALSQGDVDPGLEPVRESSREVVELRVAVAGPRRARGWGCPSSPPIETISSTLRTESPSATIRWASRSMAPPSSRPSSARAWPALSTPAATRRCTSGGSLSRRSVLEICGRERPMRRRQLLLGAAEVVEQLLVGGRLLERVELAAVQVLQQGVAQEVVVLGLLDDRRDGLLAGLLGRAPAALAHDELEADLAVAVALGLHRDGPHDDGLQHADLADRVHQLAQSSSSKTVRGWLRVRADRRRRGSRRTWPRARAPGRPERGRSLRQVRQASAGSQPRRRALPWPARRVGCGRRGGGLDGSAADNRRASGGSRAVARRTSPADQRCCP